MIFNDESVGMGFNSETGLAVGTALEDFTVQEDPVASGQEVLASITIVNSHEELMQKLGMSFEAQGRYGFFSGSAKAEFSDSTSFNSTSTFLVARCIVQNPIRRGKNFGLSQQAKDLLDALRFDEFRQAFGDSFVRGLQTGGEFYAVIRITSVSSVKQEELAVTLQAEANGLLAAGSFKGAFGTANASSNTRSEFSATMFQKAGSGASIAPTVEMAEVIARFKTFPAIANAAPVAYETEVATYDTIPLPVPTPEEQENFLLALRDAREKKLRYIQSRNDLEFALRNQSFFEALPPSDVLTSTAAVYTSLINAVMAHAITLSRGEMDPPQLFDPGALTSSLIEPAPIALKRATPPSLPSGEMIRVPDFVGLSIGELEDGQRCVGAHGVEACHTGMFADGTGIGPDGDVDPMGLSREVLSFFDLVQDDLVNFTFDPAIDATAVSADTDFVVTAQFPGTGGLVPPGGEVILQFVAVHT